MDGTAGEVSAAVTEATPVDDGPRIIEVGGPAVTTSSETEESTTTESATGLEVTPPAKVDAPEENRGKGLQDRIDEITRSRREAEREAAYWKARATANDSQQAAPKADPAAKPQREAFETEAEHIEALTDWKVTQRLNERETQQKAVQTAQEKSGSWNSKLEAARADISDFNTVLDSCEALVGSHVAEAMMEHEHGAKVAYELSKNPEMIEKLNSMSSVQAAFEVAKIGSKFDKPAEGVTPKPVAVSKAPPPATKQVGAGRSTAPTLETMPMDEYVKLRKSQGASWAR